MSNLDTRGSRQSNPRLLSESSLTGQQSLRTLSSDRSAKIFSLRVSKSFRNPRSTRSSSSS